MRIVFFFILAFVTSFCNAQFGNNHSSSSPNTLETFLGALKVNRGIINTIYPDTATANLQPIKNYPAAQIWVNDTVYIRNITATKWMAQGAGGGGGSGTVTSIGITGSDFTITNSPITTSGNINLVLATVNGNVGSFGSSTSIPTFTVNGKGLITAASGNVVIAPAGTLSGTTLNATVVTSSLTSVGTIGTGVWQGSVIASSFTSPHGIDDVLAVGQVFTDDRTINLDVHELKINALNDHLYLYLDPDSKAINLYSSPDGDVYSSLNLISDISGTVDFQLISADNVHNSVQIFGDGKAATITYTADSHVLNGAVRINDGTQQNGFVFTSDASGNGSWQAASGGGANALGTYIVQTATNAPANAQILASLATGIVKNTTTTGVLSIAVAGDFPTLNQSTTGSAATLTTGRTIAITGDLTYTSPSFNGSGNVTAAGTLATVNSNVGSFGSATQTGTFTVNGKGLITAASNVTITPAVGSITGLGTGVSTLLAATPTGGTSLVGSSSPTLVTPVLGVATATSINKLIITAPTTSATLTVIDGSSLITSGAFALTLTSTATSNATIPAGTNTLYSTLSGSITSAQLATSLTNETGTAGFVVLSIAPSMSSITLAAGTATAGTAPLYLTSGTSLTVPVSGALEFDGNALYSTTLSGRGVSPSVMFASQTATNTLSDVNTVQAVFASGFDVFTLQASTSYFFEGMYSISHGATSHSLGMSFELGGGASVTSIAYTTTCWVTAIGTNTASQTTNFIAVATNTAVNAAGSNAIENIYFSGIIRINAGGTVTPSITFSAAPGGAPVTNINSYIRFTPIGSNVVNSIGNVN